MNVSFVPVLPTSISESCHREEKRIQERPGRDRRVFPGISERVIPLESKHGGKWEHVCEKCNKWGVNNAFAFSLLQLKISEVRLVKAQRWSGGENQGRPCQKWLQFGPERDECGFCQASVQDLCELSWWRHNRPEETKPRTTESWNPTTFWVGRDF